MILYQSDPQIRPQLTGKMQRFKTPCIEGIHPTLKHLIALLPVVQRIAVRIHMYACQDGLPQLLHRLRFLTFRKYLFCPRRGRNRNDAPGTFVVHRIALNFLAGLRIGQTRSGDAR